MTRLSVPGCVIWMRELQSGLQRFYRQETLGYGPRYLAHYMELRECREGFDVTSVYSLLCELGGTENRELSITGNAKLLASCIEMALKRNLTVAGFLGLLISLIGLCVRQDVLPIGDIIMVCSAIAIILILFIWLESGLLGLKECVQMIMQTE